MVVGERAEVFLDSLCNIAAINTLGRKLLQQCRRIFAVRIAELIKHITSRGDHTLKLCLLILISILHAACKRLNISNQLASHNSVIAFTNDVVEAICVCLDAVGVLGNEFVERYGVEELILGRYRHIGVRGDNRLQFGNHCLWLSTKLRDVCEPLCGTRFLCSHPDVSIRSILHNLTLERTNCNLEVLVTSVDVPEVLLGSVDYVSNHALILYGNLAVIRA